MCVCVFDFCCRLTLKRWTVISGQTEADHVTASSRPLPHSLNWPIHSDQQSVYGDVCPNSEYSLTPQEAYPPTPTHTRLPSSSRYAAALCELMLL